MRVNPDVQSALLAGLERVTNNQQNILKQLSSGSRISTSSDDPAGAAALIQILADDAATQQNVANVHALQTQMQAADSALNSVVLALQRAITLGVEGATGTSSDSDRAAIANELNGIKDQLLELSNSALQGVYLFAGTASDERPYIADGTASGITYQGNTAINQLEIGPDYWVRTNVPGASVFGDGTNGVFKAISDLVTAVQTNSGVDAATASVKEAREQVSAARVQYGDTLNQLSSNETVLNGLHLQLQQQVDGLASANIADLASNLATAQTSRVALLSVIAKTNGISLFDYIK